MKPQNWKNLTNEQKRKIAMSLLDSMRGNYIISEALYYGIRELKKQEYAEQSNIEDMEILRETIFSLFLDPAIVEKAKKILKKQEEKSNDKHKRRR